MNAIHHTGLQKFTGKSQERHNLFLRLSFSSTFLFNSWGLLWNYTCMMWNLNKFQTLIIFPWCLPESLEIWLSFAFLHKRRKLKNIFIGTNTEIEEDDPSFAWRKLDLKWLGSSRAHWDSQVWRKANLAVSKRVIQVEKTHSCIIREILDLAQMFPIGSRFVDPIVHWMCKHQQKLGTLVGIPNWKMAKVELWASMPSCSHQGKLAPFNYPCYNIPHPLHHQVQLFLLPKYIEDFFISFHFQAATILYGSNNFWTDCPDFYSCSPIPNFQSVLKASVTANQDPWEVIWTLRLSKKQVSKNLWPFL